MNNGQPQTKNDIDSILDMVGTLKDDVMELKNHRQLTPPNRPGEAWAPCTPEEVAFYGSFKHLA